MADEPNIQAESVTLMEPSTDITIAQRGAKRDLSRLSECVVVGHGLSPKGRNWGHIIDCGRYHIVRMWNYHWQDKEDYGERYDWGYFEISPVEMKRFFKHNCRTPQEGWLASTVKDYDGPLPSGLTEHIDPANQRWVQAAMQLGGHGEGNKQLKLTRGVRAAAWAIEYSFKRVILVGFDNVRAGISLSIEEGFPPACIACPAGFPFRTYEGGKVRYSSHDYSVEWPFLSAL